MSFALFFLKTYIVKYGSLVPTFVSMVAGTLMVVAACCIAGVDFRTLSKISMRDGLLLVYLGVGATAVVYLIFNKAIEAVGVVTATGFKFLIPVFGIALSILFLREKPGVFMFIGTAVIVVSIILIQGPPRRGS